MPTSPRPSLFRSLRVRNYRIWAAGAIVSNIGTWMQRTAQDWIVLAELTHHSASAVGLVMSLQFAPQILFLPLTGSVADRFDRRKVVFLTQAAMGLLALALGLLTVFHLVRLWQVDVFAFLLGTVAAFDSPARQTFVSELVGEADLANAVGLNSTSFNSARLIGPAVAGLLIASIGTGWVFLLNAISFAAVLLSLTLLRVEELHRPSRPSQPQSVPHASQPHRDAWDRHNSPKPPPSRLPLSDAFSYIAHRADLRTVFLMLFLVGTFGLNFPIFISTMSLTVFHAGARQFGLLSSAMAIGSVLAALMAARRERPGITVLLSASAVFAAGCALAAVMPTYWLFGLALVLIGLAAQTFTTTTLSFLQLSTDPAMRGRVIAIMLAVAMGTTPLGAPIVGWVADRFGPRWSLAVAAIAAAIAALIATAYLTKHRNLRLDRTTGRLRLTFDPAAEDVTT